MRNEGSPSFSDDGQATWSAKSKVLAGFSLKEEIQVELTNLKTTIWDCSKKCQKSILLLFTLSCSSKPMWRSFFCLKKQNEMLRKVTVSVPIHSNVNCIFSIQQKWMMTNTCRRKSYITLPLNVIFAWTNVTIKSSTCH